jgi:hypothetical protein
MNDRDWPLTDKDFPAANPYAATAFSSTAPAGDFGSQASAEEVRNRFLKHEASVQSIGTLYLLGAVFLLLAGGVMVISLIVLLVNGPAGDPAPTAAGFAIPAVILLAFGALQFWVGLGLRKLEPSARIVASVFSVLGLLGIPIGTLISAYFLYLLLSKKGEFVFSPEYARVRAATPHIKYRTSIIVVIAVALLFLLLFLGVIGFFLAG